MVDELKEFQNMIDKLAKDIALRLITDSPQFNNKNEVDYMCSNCNHCLFYKTVNMGMDGTYYVCLVNEPKDNYFNGHLMHWVSARDCENVDINKLYHRQCSSFCSFDAVIQEKINKLKSDKNF